MNHAVHYRVLQFLLPIVPEHLHVLGNGHFALMLKPAKTADAIMDLRKRPEVEIVGGIHNASVCGHENSKLHCFHFRLREKA